MIRNIQCTLRSSYMNNQIDEGKDINLIKKITGHGLDVLQRHYDRSYVKKRKAEAEGGGPASAAGLLVGDILLLATVPLRGQAHLQAMIGYSKRRDMAVGLHILRAGGKVLLRHQLDRRLPSTRGLSTGRSPSCSTGTAA